MSLDTIQDSIVLSLLVTAVAVSSLYGYLVLTCRECDGLAEVEAGI